MTKCRGAVSTDSGLILDNGTSGGEFELPVENQNDDSPGIQVKPFLLRNLVCLIFQKWTDLKATYILMLFYNGITWIVHQIIM